MFLLDLDHCLLNCYLCMTGLNHLLIGGHPLKLTHQTLRWNLWSNFHYLFCEHFSCAYLMTTYQKMVCSTCHILAWSSGPSSSPLDLNGCLTYAFSNVGYLKASWNTNYTQLCVPFLDAISDLLLMHRFLSKTGTWYHWGLNVWMHCACSNAICQKIVCYMACTRSLSLGEWFPHAALVQLQN